MRSPHFQKLAEIDDHRFIMGCRHGMVHLTWGRMTLRFQRDEFRRLAGILARAVDGLPPVFVEEGEIHVAYRADESELRLSTLILLLPDDELFELTHAIQDAIRRLDDVLTSGVWADEESADDTPRDPTASLGGTRFSRN